MLIAFRIPSQAGSLGLGWMGWLAGWLDVLGGRLWGLGWLAGLSWNALVGLAWLRWPGWKLCNAVNSAQWAVSNDTGVSWCKDGLRC